MSHAIATAVDLAERFGAIALSRIRTNPPPGTAREEDVVEIHDREDRLCELVDGVLVEKTVGTYEAYLAALLVRVIGDFVEQENLGIVLGPDGMVRLVPGLVRIPDVSFISWDRLPDRRIPREALWDLAPNLAVEVISKGNTAEEMERKLHDYFAAGVQLVWYVYPATRQVHVFGSLAEGPVELSEPETLEGGDLLPGFSMPLARLFAEPKQGSSRAH